MVTWKRVVSILGIVCLTSVVTKLCTHSSAWYASKLQSIEAEQRHSAEMTDSLRTLIDKQGRQIDSLLNMHPWKQGRKKWSSNVCKSGTFFGFILYTPVDTTLTQEFKIALEDYKGPQVKINSLKRHYNRKSDHYWGKAVDLEFSQDLINWLISEDGQTWLIAYDLHFYIEGKPGSQKVRKYLKDPATASYVFFNPEATGNHVHIGTDDKA